MHLSTFSRTRLLALLLTLVSGARAAQVPELLNFQGRVLVGTTPFEGTGRFKFALVNATGLSTYWSHDGSVTVGGTEPAGSVAIPVSQGLYSLQLGDTGITGMSPVPPTVFTNSDVRLRVWFSDGAHGFERLAPDQRIGSVGYAMAVAALAPGSVQAHHLDPSLATTLQLNTNNPVFPGTVTAGRFEGGGGGLTGVNAATLEGLSSGGFWKSTGNAGTLAGLHFIGTTDARPLEFRASNHRVLRIAFQPGTDASFDDSVVLVGGHPSNAVASGVSAATISGGGMEASPNRIEVEAHSSTIGGGIGNRVSGRYGSIGGGADNQVDGLSGVVSGGSLNRIGESSWYASVGGGQQNAIGARNTGAFIGGGMRNSIADSTTTHLSPAPAILGGADNVIGTNDVASVIAGGSANSIGGQGFASFIAGGRQNAIAENVEYGFAAGHRAHANHHGSFVWADSTDADYQSVRANTFNIRARGGLYLEDETSLRLGASHRQMINLWNERTGIGTQPATHYFRTPTLGTFSWFEGGSHASSPNDPGPGGLEVMRLSSAGLQVHGTVSSASDRALKQDVRAVDPDAVLERVAALPIAEWSYKADAAVRHMGPMAQDFQAAFSLGSDDRHIATVDADGVALAAIQGLNRKLEAAVQDRDEKIHRLESRLAALEETLRSMASATRP